MYTRSPLHILICAYEIFYKISFQEAQEEEEEERQETQK